MTRDSIAQLSATHVTVDKFVRIDATPAEVCATLTDFDTISCWSTGTLRVMPGDIRDRRRVTITFIYGTNEHCALSAMETPDMLTYDKGFAFGWSDPFPDDIGGGHDNHLHRVAACGDQTLFIQSVEIVAPLGANFVTQLLPMYQKINAEHRTEVEDQP